MFFESFNTTLVLFKPFSAHSKHSCLSFFQYYSSSIQTFVMKWNTSGLVAFQYYSSSIQTS